MLNAKYKACPVLMNLINGILANPAHANLGDDSIVALALRVRHEMIVRGLAEPSEDERPKAGRPKGS